MAMAADSRLPIEFGEEREGLERRIAVDHAVSIAVEELAVVLKYERDEAVGGEKYRQSVADDAVPSDFGQQLRVVQEIAPVPRTVRLRDAATMEHPAVVEQHGRVE